MACTKKPYALLGIASKAWILSAILCNLKPWYGANLVRLERLVCADLDLFLGVAWMMRSSWTADKTVLRTLHAGQASHEQRCMQRKLRRALRLSGWLGLLGWFAFTSSIFRRGVLWWQAKSKVAATYEQTQKTVARLVAKSFCLLLSTWTH